MMKAMFGAKVAVVLLALAAAMVLIVLASSLDKVKFTSPFLVKVDNVYALDSVGADDQAPAPKWFRYSIIVAIVIIFLLFLGPIRPQTSSSLIKRLLLFAGGAFLFMIVMGRFARTNPFITGEFDTTTGSESPTLETLEPFSAPEVTTGWVFWITAIVVVVASVVGVILFNRLMDKWGQPKELDGIAEIARSTLQELSAEKPPRNAIIRCYTRMTGAVTEARGLSRNESMTPSEFVEHLALAGLPREDIEGLTRIFERVRYGAQSVEAEEIKDAKRRLTNIVNACKVQI